MSTALTITIFGRAKSHDTRSALWLVRYSDSLRQAGQVQAGQVYINTPDHLFLDNCLHVDVVGDDDATAAKTQNSLQFMLFCWHFKNWSWRKHLWRGMTPMCTCVTFSVCAGAKNETMALFFLVCEQLRRSLTLEAHSEHILVKNEKIRWNLVLSGYEIHSTSIVPTPV